MFGLISSLIPGLAVQRILIRRMRLPDNGQHHPPPGGARIQQRALPTGGRQVVRRPRRSDLERVPRQIGRAFGDTRDTDGRQRFIPFNVEDDYYPYPEVHFEHISIKIHLKFNGLMRRATNAARNGPSPSTTSTIFSCKSTI